MAHPIEDKQKLLNRVSRIRGQVEAVQRSLDEERGCDEVLQTIAACRGAIDGLMAELVVGHIQQHLTDGRADSERSRAARVLIDVVNAYLR